MGLFVSNVKLKAAAGSMHQFCPKVRCIFPTVVDDAVVEAATAFLYLQTANDILGRHFANKLARALIDKFRSPAREQMARISRMSAMLDSAGACREFHEFITRVVQCLLQEAGCSTNDQATLRECFQSFQEVVMPMKDHLMGIKKQNTFIMKRAG